jgi:hypothetical protein
MVTKDAYVVKNSINAACQTTKTVKVKRREKSISQLATKQLVTKIIVQVAEKNIFV